MTSLTDRLKVHLHSTRFSLLNFFLLRSLKSGNPLSCKFFANFSVWNSVWKRGESQKPFLQNWGRPPSIYFGAKTDREGEKSGECKLGWLVFAMSANVRTRLKRGRLTSVQKSARTHRPAAAEVSASLLSLQICTFFRARLESRPRSANIVIFATVAILQRDDSAFFCAKRKDQRGRACANKNCNLGEKRGRNMDPCQG